MSESKLTPPTKETAKSDPQHSRRTPAARPKKSSKRPKLDEDVDTKPDQPAYPTFDLAEPDELPGSSSSGESSSQEKPKRKRRHKKSKGGASQNTVVVGEAEEPVEEKPAAAVDALSRPAQQPRLKLDPESVAKLAWKIYLAEVSEEGVALIGDSDAKELSRRCFRLAEIFVEEQSRRR